MPNILSLNELRSSFTAVEENLDQIVDLLLQQIKEAADSGEDMHWVQHLAKQVETVRKEIRAVKTVEDHAADVLMNTLNFEPDSDHVSDVGLRTLFIEITQGMINQHLLTLTDAKRNGRVSAGEKFKITLPDGCVFDTELCDPGNKLRERGHIRRFYEDASITEGDKVVLKEVNKGSWRLIAGTTDEGASEINALFLKTYGLEPGELDARVRREQEEEAEARKAVEKEERE